MRRSRGVIGAVLAAGALAWGCGAAPVSLSRNPRAYTAEAYPEALSRWTRTGQAFTLRGFFDDQLAVTATYESWDFRWAYVVRYAADFHLTSDERTRLLRASLGAADNEHEFYVALSVPTRRWGDLASPTAAWRVMLVNDRQQEVLPLAIEPVRQPGALERTYFPYTTVWRQVYRIRFPVRVAAHAGGEPEALISTRSRYFILRFAGPVGQVDLTWNVEG
ncbi:MAG: hypothetical protein U0326_06795 [Polyangiales bacterium]